MPVAGARRAWGYDQVRLDAYESLGREVIPAGNTQRCGDAERLGLYVPDGDIDAGNRFGVCGSKLFYGLGKFGESLGAPVDEVLHPPAQWVEKGGNRQGGEDNADRRLLTANCLEQALQRVPAGRLPPHRLVSDDPLGRLGGVPGGHTPERRTDPRDAAAVGGEPDRSGDVVAVGERYDAGRHRRGDRRVRIGVRAADAAHGVGATVLLMIGVQNEENIQGLL